jgi:hypothetical protein
MPDNLIKNDDDLNVGNINTIEWSPEHEKILIEWADKAMCFRWLHSKANAMYNSLNAWYTIPVIVISTLTGTANFAQERVPLAYQNYFVMIVGGFNILAGIITTIQQFLKITQLNEAHRVSGIAWDKFYRNIKIEIAKHPSERIEPKQMLKMSKEEFDRLMETSPIIPEQIIQEFKEKFKSQDSFKDIVKPEICDILIPTIEYKNPWSNDENITKSINEKSKFEIEKQNKIKKTNHHNYQLINEFITSFMNVNNREPMDTEIIDNLKEKVDINVINNIIEKRRTKSNNDNSLNNIV